MKHRLSFAAKKLARILLLLWGVSVLSFLLVSASPIDPLQANIGQTALGAMSPEQVAKLEQYWGMDVPVHTRYTRWASDLLRGDFGVSLLYRQPAASVIADKLANSLWLMAIAWLFSGILGLTLGILAGSNRGGAMDRAIQGGCLFLASTPAFWLALLLLTVFSVWLKLLPVGFSIPIGLDAGSVTFFDRMRHAVLPALTLSITGVPAIALHTREKMADVMESDYVLFARARGERRNAIIVQHGLRNILLPAITLQFGSISEIFGGSILVEQVFSYPGLGQAAVTAGLGSDIPLLLGITVVSAAIVFFGNFAADLLYGIIDPRIRRGRARE